MSVYGNMAQGFIGGAAAGMALSKRRDEKEDRQIAQEKLARKQASEQAFIDQWTKTFADDDATPEPAAPAPAAPVAAIPAPAAPAPAMSAVPAAPSAAIPAAAPAPAAPEAAPRKLTRKSDLFQLERAAFEHALKYEDSGIDGAMKAVENVRGKMYRDGMAAFRAARAAFTAGDYTSAVRLSQQASKFSPDGYVPVFKQGADGQLLLRLHDENNGAPVTDPVVVTEELLKNLEEQYFIKPKDARELRRKEAKDAADIEDAKNRTAAYEQDVENRRELGAVGANTDRFVAYTGRMQAETEATRAANASTGSSGSGVDRRFNRQRIENLIGKGLLSGDSADAVINNLPAANKMNDRLMYLFGDDFSTDAYIAAWAEDVSKGASPEEATVYVIEAAQATEQARLQAEEAGAGTPSAAARAGPLPEQPPAQAIPAE